MAPGQRRFSESESAASATPTTSAAAFAAKPIQPAVATSAPIEPRLAVSSAPVQLLTPTRTA